MGAMKPGGRKAVVVGGSVAGLLAGALLLKKGWDVDVYERSDVELAGRGAGILSHPELENVLVEAGADLSSYGIRIRDRIMFDSTGKVTRRHHFPQTLTSWDRVQTISRRLISDDRYHLAHDFVAFEQHANAVVAHFANGKSVTADLLVGADGFRSAVRGIIAPDIQPIYAGYVIWRSVAEESELDPKVHAEIFDKLAFQLEHGHEVVTFAMAGLKNNMAPGQQRCNFVWYRTVDDATLADMLTDASGTRYAISIPPPLVRQDVIQDMLKDADRFMCPQMRSVLATCKSIFFTPIYDLLSPSLVSGRVVMIGDAASVGRPHVGLGVTKGAADALALAQALAANGNDVVSGLKAYDSVRQPIAERVVKRGRELGAFLNSDPDAPPSYEETEKHFAEFLHNTGNPDFLYQ